MVVAWCGSIAFARASGHARKPGLPFPGGPGGPGGPGPPTGKWQFLAGGPPTSSGTPCGRPANWKWQGMEGNLPVAWVGTGRFAGQAPATGTAGTTETTGIVPGRRFALGIGSRASHGPIARCGSIAFARANGQVRKPGLSFPGGLGGPGGPGPPTGKWQFLSGGPPTSSGNSSRAVRQLPAALLAGGPPTGSGPPKKISLTPLRAVRKFAILAASADGPGSRKERDGVVLLGG